MKKFADVGTKVEYLVKNDQIKFKLKLPPVFDSSTIDLIEKIRFITDLYSLAKDVKKKRKVIVVAVNAKRFVEYTRATTSTPLDLSLIHI